MEMSLPELLLQFLLSRCPVWCSLGTLVPMPGSQDLSGVEHLCESQGLGRPARSCHLLGKGLLSFSSNTSGSFGKI